MLDRTLERPHSYSHAPAALEQTRYLARCQVDTPAPLVDFVWHLVNERRPNAGHVIDNGCGDGRFGARGTYESYLGIEVDPSRRPVASLHRPATVKIGCAFDDAQKNTFDTCIGNPPYVRHHDLDEEWITRIETKLKSMIEYERDGRSNAYIYFMWLALASTKDNGLTALVIPYEWISRPGSAKLRNYIHRQKWAVDTYYLKNASFERVLTTACVTIIDKAQRTGAWRIFEVQPDGEIRTLTQKTRTREKLLAYENAAGAARAIRGLSPGGQKTFVLTEEDRIRFRLTIGSDVVPAVTSFRDIDETQLAFTETFFRNNYVNRGKRCWLINPTRPLSEALRDYLEQVPKAARDNYTCSVRSTWWEFNLPAIPDILYASGFKGIRPKIFRNELGAVHVGGIHGIHCRNSAIVATVLARLRELNLSKKVVALSNGFLKIEVNQMNAVLNSILKRPTEGERDE